MIQTLDVTQHGVAEKILGVQIPSYRVEADLIQFDGIPTLSETVEQLRACCETFIGYWIDEELAGVVSYRVNGRVIDIHRMMVHPTFFRRGVARSLLLALEDAEPNWASMTVQTGADNRPAIRLYENAGFRKTGYFEVANGALWMARFEKRSV